MVAAAHLAFNLALPTESAGAKHLSLPDRETEWVRKLYENGAVGFYDVVLYDRGWRVEAGKWIDWPTDSETSGIERILPRMQPDIVLQHSKAGRRVVIDTKFSAVVTSGWCREESLRSKYV